MKTVSRSSEPPSAASEKDRAALLHLYEACLQNAEELLEEAQLLLDAGHAARAFALAYTGYEEVGKSQIVADHLNDVASAKEFKKAFSDHKLKAAYLQRFLALVTTQPNEAVVQYDGQSAKALFEARKSALYVDHSPDLTPVLPSAVVSAAMASEAIEAVQGELYSIHFAEDLNGRIGTKGLFK